MPVKLQENTECNIWPSGSDSAAHILVYLGSQPLDRLFGIRVLWHTDGLLLSWKSWIKKLFAGLQTLFQESLEVLLLKLDRVLDGAQSCLHADLNAVSELTVKKKIFICPKYVSS